MKKILTILLLILSLTAEADKWYIATAANGGDDTDGDGSITAPWLTLKHAADTVTGAAFVGDTIVVGVGSFTETAQIAVGAGVSIYGAGATSIILAGAALDPMFLLSSASENTDGAQTISYIQVDGDLTALFGFSVRQRSNVIFHHITMVDFIYSAIEYYGGASFTTIPTAYASGNAIHNSTLTNNCSRRDPGAFGTIRLGGTIGMEIYDCVLTQTGRASTENGNLLYLWGATNKALKFHDNICTKPTLDGVISGNAGGWNFHIESGHSFGYEIYNNTFVGGVALDLAGGIQTKGEYDYSWYIHDNDFSIATQIATPSPSGQHAPHAVDYERTNEDVIFTRNLVSNYPTALNLTLSSSDYHFARLTIAYNIFTDVGYSDGGYAYGAIQFVGAVGATGDLCSDIYIYNNVMDANNARGLIMLQSPYNMDAIYIRNNIIIDAITWGWLIAWDKLGDAVTNTGTYTGFYIDNNILYNNVSANAIYQRNGKEITLTSNADNLVGSDPLFIPLSNYHVQSTSPAIDAGMDVDLIRDYDNNVVGASPDIGAFEYTVLSPAAGKYVVKDGKYQMYGGRLVINPNR